MTIARRTSGNYTPALQRARGDGALIRHKQPATTRLFPHADNARYMVPNSVREAPEPEPSTFRLVSVGDTIITLPVGLVTTLASKLEYDWQMDDAPPSNNQMPWSSEPTATAARSLRAASTGDFNVERGGVRASTGVFFSYACVFLHIEEAVPAPNVVDWTVTPITPPGAPSSGSATVGSALDADSLILYQNTAALTAGIVGALRDFKIYDSSAQLIHHWPIDEGEGTVIADIVGGADGVLSIGAGHWEPIP